jgi:hypothetical protein
MPDVRLKWIPAAILSAFAVTVPLADAAESAESPRLVVPDVRDVMIKTRRTFDAPGSTVVTDILYLKGPWQRREEILEFPKNTGVRTVRPYVAIVRCDERRIIQLNDAARTFASSNIEMIRDGLRSVRSASGSPQASSGASVNITIDIVETGERRQLGYHVAHHVITTTKTDAAPEANARSGVLIQDAWYIDVPPAGCIDWGDHPPMLSGSVVRAGSMPDRVHVDRRGTPRRGLVIEETTRTGSDEQRPTERVTLVEYSEATLDPSIFAIPQSYRPALPRLRGGFDLARTDTIANRLRDYWEELASWAHDFWF